MQIKNEFNVSLPPAETWAVLMDIERIAPCMPGAKITEVVDERTFKGQVAVRLGPVALTFGGIAEIKEIDEANKKAQVSASGSDPKGRGGANANVNFSLEDAAKGTRVEIVTDLQLSGAVAQYGRGAGMISELATQLVGQFATNLNAQLAAENNDAVTAPQADTELGEPATADKPTAAAAPISGLSLGLRVLWNSIKRLFGAS